MALTPTVLFDAFILINANNLSDHIQKIDPGFTFEDLDATAFGQTAHVRRNGLQDGSVAITFLNDFTAANLDAIMWPLAGGLPVSFEIRPTSAARSATNPAMIGNLLINSWKPISGDVGKLVTVDVSYPTSGLTTRVIA
jgi:hypothetical protein